MTWTCYEYWVPVSILHTGKRYYVVGYYLRLMRMARRLHGSKRKLV